MTTRLLTGASIRVPVNGHPPILVTALERLGPRHIPGYVAVAAFWWADTFRMLPR